MQFKIIIIFILVTTILNAQSIVVDDTRTAQDLVQNVLINNSGCATISSPSVSGGNFGTAENSYAYFNSNGSNFPFAEGVVLSTGKAVNTQGPNNTLSDDDANNWLTDPDLDAIFGNTLNATILEFDFQPKTGFISFEYIFASEEYQEGNPNTCQFSDVFAFLIKPVGGTYTNIAVVPNTQIPVEVTTVHPEIPNGCSAQNEIYFGSWNNSSHQAINFNGQTAVLKAESTVVPNTQYHIKLVIADHQNFRFDSAVFLNAGSFNVGNNLGDDRLSITTNPLCGNEQLTLDAGSAASSYQWYKFNDVTQNYDALPLPEGDDQMYTIFSNNINSLLGSGIYKVIANFGFGCLAESKIEIEYVDLPSLDNAELIKCVDDLTEITVFDLFDAFSIITADTTLVIEDFYHTQPEAEMQTNVISNSTNYPFTAQEEVVVARVRNTSGCINFANITLKRHLNPEIEANETIFYCLNEFPIKITLENGLLNANTVNHSTTWYKDDIHLINEQDNDTIEIDAIGNYKVEITNTNNCTVSRKITVLPSEIAIFDKVLVTENEFYKKVSIIIKVTGQGDYEYAIDSDGNYQDKNYFDNISYGLHTVYIRDKNGCGTIQEEILLLEYPKFITPNNDGVYDTWNINNINAISNNFNTITNIIIFDRYGKVMANINPNGLGWDGNYLGNPAPSSTYWFSINLIDFKGELITKKGYFSLNRIK